MDINDMDYHVFWVSTGSIGNKTEGVEYRKITNSPHLNNLFRKHFGGAEEIKKAISEDRLRVLLGTEIKPVPTTTYKIGETYLGE